MHPRIEFEQQCGELHATDLAVERSVRMFDALGLLLGLVASEIQILATNPYIAGGDRVMQARERRL